MSEWIVHCTDCLYAWRAVEWQTCPNCGGHSVFSTSGPGPDDPNDVVGAALRKARDG